MLYLLGSGSLLSAGLSFDQCVQPVYPGILGRLRIIIFSVIKQ